MLFRSVVVAGLGLIASGLFAADPALGYPPGAPAGLPTDVSWHAGVHYLGALVVFLGLPTAMAIATQRAPVAATRIWAYYSLVSALIMVGGWLATFAFSGADGTLAIAGLLQRIAVVGGFQWIVATASIELAQADVAAPAHA